MMCCLMLVVRLATTLLIHRDLLFMLVLLSAKRGERCRWSQSEAKGPSLVSTGAHSNPCSSVSLRACT